MIVSREFAISRDLPSSRIPGASFVERISERMAHLFRRSQVTEAVSPVTDGRLDRDTESRIKATNAMFSRLRDVVDGRIPNRDGNGQRLFIII